MGSHAIGKDMMRDAPAYPHSATIGIDSARWIATHRVNRVESIFDGLLLTAGNAAHRLPCNWGIRMGEGGREGVVELIMPVRNHIDGILEWEAANPDQHPVAGQPDSFRHRAWSGLRALVGDALEAALDPEVAAAARARHDGHPVAGLHLRPAGTRPHVLEGGGFVVAATLGADRIRHAPGDVGVIAIGRAGGSGVRWLHMVPDQCSHDVAAMMDRRPISTT